MTVKNVLLVAFLCACSVTATASTFNTGDVGQIINCEPGTRGCGSNNRGKVSTRKTYNDYNVYTDGDATFNTGDVENLCVSEGGRRNCNNQGRRNR
jgi:hypothetical protein